MLVVELTDRNGDALLFRSLLQLVIVVKLSFSKQSFSFGGSFQVASITKLPRGSVTFFKFLEESNKGVFMLCLIANIYVN